ncbi:MAG: tyrosine--tRNA ligase [Candidatus Omnitrophica bacterium]|nr:tyrosine--tRNA ligase [Candidatus Omnitrophota bacterium]MDD5591983.1 tyrosine--tRNA ligase [Candidatus Omnitrophota bacterium]
MDINKQLEIIRRGAVEIISEEELKLKLEKSLKEGRSLRVKAGFDPTSADIHLGHTVLLRKLRQFQDLGHQVIFLIGDFTARIGDPSGQNKARRVPSAKEIKANSATYKKQVFKILDSRKTKIVFNSSWLNRLKGLEFGRLLTHYTATRLLERDDFSLRIKEQKPLYMSEFIYPILQGYDSVVLKADIEIGGNDQKFNLIVGRELQKDFGQSPQVIVTLPLLEGTDGVNKMSKSLGNYIGINEAPKEMFGKTMSVSDELMFKYYTLLTDEDLETVKKMHPKQAKLNLAEKITSQYHGSRLAKEARAGFERVFSQGELPEDAPVYKLKEGGVSLIDVLLDSGLMESKNEARRLIKQGGVSFADKRLDSEDSILDQEGILKVGKKRFLRLEK